jgi:DNA-binding transcriptional LysR family regulator
LPASLTRREGPPVETRPLRPQPRLPVYLIWRRGRHLSAAAGAFIEFVRAETVHQ